MGGGGGKGGEARKIISHTLPEGELKVFVENRVRAKLEHQKVKILEEILERGNKATAWRGFDEKLPEIVAFGGTGLRNMVMAITGAVSEKPDHLYVFYFEPNIGKQETEVKQLKSTKHQKGAGGLYEFVQKNLKGTVDIKKIVIKKTKEQLAEIEQKEAEEAAVKHAEETSIENLDAQVAAIALEQRANKQNAAVEDAPSYDDLDAFM